MCSVELTYAAGSTSSMRKNLALKHPSLSKEKLSKGKALVRPVTDMFHRPIQGEKYERINKAAVLMRAEDLRPLSIVNGAGFCKFCKELNPAYKVPSHTTLHNYLMRIYSDEKSALVKLFGLAQQCMDI